MYYNAIFRKFAAIALLCFVVNAASCAMASTITGAQNFQLVDRLTGPLISGHVNVGGTDLGHMVNHNGRTYFLFGDTFASEGPGGFDWRNNVMAWTTDVDPSDGLAFDGWLTRPNGTARQAITPGTQPVTYIPTGAISVGDKIYAWYMHVSNWNTGWTLSHAGLAWWREGDSQFTTVPNYQFSAPSGGPYSTANGTEGPGNFGMVAASYRSPLEYSNDSHIYIWGTPGGREGGVKLARVLPHQIENLSSYQYFHGLENGVPVWGNSEFTGHKLVDSGVGEMSVMYNDSMRAWTMMYGTGGTTPEFQMRYSDTPWGPWSNPITVARFDQAPGLYAPYMNPLYVEDGGKTLYFTMSLWEPYDVYLAKVDLDLSLQTRWRGNLASWFNDSVWSHGRPSAEHDVRLDNHGTIHLSSAEAAQNFTVGTDVGSGGTLRITGGALSVNREIRLAAASQSFASLIMEGGTIEVLDASRPFIFGESGNADAAISGGTIIAPSITIANQPTASAHIELSGDAVLTTTGDRFQLARLRNPANGQRALASLSMAGGTINVTNQNNGVADFVAGLNGEASIDLSSGNINVAGNFLAAASASLGQAAASRSTITHSGGTINTGAMILGERGISDYLLSSNGNIEVRDSMRLAAFAGSHSLLTQYGGTIQVGLNHASPDLIGYTIGAGGNAIHTLNNGDLDVFGRMILGDAAGSVGRLNINGGKVNVAGDVAAGINGTGRLTQTGGQFEIGGAFQLAASSSSSNAVHIHSGGILNVAGSMNIGFASGTANSAISGGVVEVTDELRLWSKGYLALQGGELSANAIRHNEGGTFQFLAGSLRFQEFHGDLVNQGGALNPEPSITGAAILGNYTQLSAAKINITVGADAPSHLLISGNTSLDGELNISLAAGHIPLPNEAYTVIEFAAGMTGQFINIANGQRLHTADGSGSFLVHYGAQSIYNLNQLILSHFQSSSSSGDFNGDGNVDAADFVIWRRGIADGTMSTSEYDEWRTHFGKVSTIQINLTGESPVPEPPQSVFLLVAASIVHTRVRRSKRGIDAVSKPSAKGTIGESRFELPSALRTRPPIVASV